jgi:hypothetical protein
MDLCLRQSLLHNNYVKQFFQFINFFIEGLAQKISFLLIIISYIDIK